MVDFTRALALFLSSEQEVAAALGIPLGDVRAYRNNPARVPPDIITKFGKVLVERGQGMQRVGELMQRGAD